MFIKKEVFNKYKFCEDKNLSGSEDWDLWLRIASFEEIFGYNFKVSIENNIYKDHCNKYNDKRNNRSIFKL